MIFNLRYMRNHSAYIKFAPWVLLSIFSLICYLGQIEKSITVDEFSHFPSGIYNLLTMDWRMDYESPPLIKCLPAVTCIITQPKIDIRIFKMEPNPWSLGYHFMYNNQTNYQNIFRYGRCIIILIWCVLGWLIYTFGTQLFGPVGGLFALFLYIFNPNIIAHSSLTTIDIGASCFIFLSIYCFWRYLKKKDLAAALFAGGTLGLAQLSKFTALLLYPVFIIIIAVLIFERDLLHRSSRNAENTLSLKDVAYFLIILLVSLFVINAGYFFSGTFRPIADYQFLSKTLKNISIWMWGSFPVPLPFDYLSGFDSQMAISEGGNPFYASYLMGEHSLDGWWYYYLIAFLIKNPLAFLIILILTVILWGKTACIKLEDSLCIWVPVIIFLSYFSFFTHIPIGVRFLLPVFPLIFVSAGSLLNKRLLDKKKWKTIIAILAIAYLIPAIFSYPNYLSYFNIIAGGPDNGHRWLIDSNLDWGQDLPGLKRYMERNEINEIKLGYFGRVDPEIYGIKYTLPNRQLEHGIYAISVNFLVGRPYYMLKDNPKELVYVDLDYFKKYKSLKPIEVINNTIYIFKITNNG